MTTKSAAYIQKFNEAKSNLDQIEDEWPMIEFGIGDGFLPFKVKVSKDGHLSIGREHHRKIVIHKDMVVELFDWIKEHFIDGLDSE